MSAGDAIAQAVDEAAAGFDDIERVPVGDGLELRRDGRGFARIDPDGAAFRLGPAVAAAAARTTGASRSALGPDWVTLHPATVDRFTLDRVAAWLEMAWRMAGRD